MMVSKAQSTSLTGDDEWYADNLIRCVTLVLALLAKALMQTFWSRLTYGFVYR